jgi:hypothetical protein
MREPPADVPLRISIRAFDRVRKRPLAAIPAKLKRSGFAATAPAPSASAVTGAVTGFLDFGSNCGEIVSQ